ncbi:MAG: MBL fold metallo-hydrolase [Candidatus Dormibacteraeota bacterium]|nr:MBL fold metallo-hydrolase [Candidatus Dormibacteraeota bacterium]
MRLNDDVHVLVLPFEREGQPFPMHLTLVLDATQGPTLIDAGLPGQRDAIAAAMAEAGVRLEDLGRIVLTHHDIDHVGALADLVAASGARVLTSAGEAPFIDGRATPRYALPEVLERRPEFRAVVERLRPTPVDEELEDGARLEVAGGLQVVTTPGHTPGHMCLFLERSGTLVSGDALAAQEGRLLGPSPSATMDLPTARRSVRKLAPLEVRSIVCYHGGVVEDDAAGQLRRLADELESQPA